MKIIVLDYNVGDVHIYTVPEDINGDEFIDQSEHKASECNWMIVQELNIIFH